MDNRSWPVPFKWDHPTLGCAFQKLLFQGLVSLFFPYSERDVHAASTGRVHGTPGQVDTAVLQLILVLMSHLMFVQHQWLCRRKHHFFNIQLWKILFWFDYIIIIVIYLRIETIGGVDDVVNHAGLLPVELLHGSAATIVLDPLQDQAHDIDAE